MRQGRFGMVLASGLLLLYAGGLALAQQAGSSESQSNGYPTEGAYAAELLTGLAIGTAVTAASFQESTEVKTVVIVTGVTYHQVGSTWYQPVYQGSQVTYVVVNPPK